MSRQNQVHNHETPTGKQQLTTDNHNQHSPKNSTMLLTQSELTPQTTTDQYQHTETIWRIIIDIITLSILLTVTCISHFVAMPFTRGYFCSDVTIKYPYKDNTIPTYAAVLLSIVLPLVWMWATEICKKCYFTRYPKQLFLTRIELCGTRITSMTPFVRNLYMLTVVFAYGYLATWVLLEVAKNFVGELRPHFLAVCQSTYDCSAATLTLNQFNSYLQFGINYTCLNTDDAIVREARRSFFSGHTAPVFFGFGFLIMYIHVSWSWRHLGILGHIFQVGLAVLGSYIGYTRISDFHHHWQDVTVGAIVGSLIAFFTFKFILNWRHYSPAFLPYTVARVQPKEPLTPNGGASVINPNHFSSNTDPEQHHYF